MYICEYLQRATICDQGYDEKGVGLVGREEDGKRKRKRKKGKERKRKSGRCACDRLGTSRWPRGERKNEQDGRMEKERKRKM